VLDGLLFSPGLDQVAPEFREDVLGPQRPVNAFLGDRQQGVSQVRLEENARVEQDRVHAAALLSAALDRQSFEGYVGGQLVEPGVLGVRHHLVQPGGPVPP
jgi:hypothetical protein